MVDALTLSNAIHHVDLIRKLLFGKMVIYGGIDRGGKGTALCGVRTFLESLGFKCFDLLLYEKEHHDLPPPSEFGGFDFITTIEPGWSGVGHALRQEILKQGSGYSFVNQEILEQSSVALKLLSDRTYSVQTTAMAFALDREIRYKRCYAPARKMGLPIFSERGIESALVCQPVQARVCKEELDLDWMLQLPGNALALHPTLLPSLMQIVHCRPEVVLRTRNDSVNLPTHYFATDKYLYELDKVYRSTLLTDFFGNHGIPVIDLETSDISIEETKRISVNILLSYLNTQLLFTGK